MSYATEENLENYLAIDADATLSAQLALWSLGVDNYIDKYTGITFKTSLAEDRFFDGKGGTEMELDEFFTINTVEILESSSDDVRHSLTEGKGNDFIVYPYNEAVKHRISLTTNSAAGRFPIGERRIKINADWGQENVPEDIALAATMLLAGIVEKGLKGGSVLSESLGDYSVTYKLVDDISSVMGVKEILDYHRVYEL